jgi:endonuclease/exonuclease/phosphatase family metal-dependent hydrolase
MATIAFAVAQDGQGVFRRYASMNFEKRGDTRFRVAFYNVENLFDLVNDSLTSDEAFTPEGENKYTYSRYKKKSDGLAKTMLAIGGWEAVELIGLCEVESAWVMDGLTKHSPMKEANYKYIHKDSPDFRGIDVACIYRPDKFNLISYRYYRVRFPWAPDRTTRDILYVKGRLPNEDTLHVFFNHWPSRYGGQFASEQGRIFVADMIRQKVDSLNERFQNPYIIITGDFNDYPNDISLTEHLKALHSPAEASGNDLVNLSFPIMHKFGTHSFAGEWGVLDHMIVSNSLLQPGGTRVYPTEVGIFDAPWLLKKNAAGNVVTNRTYQGPAYVGGYSDHLPIFIDLHLQKRLTPEAESEQALELRGD